MTWVFLYAYTFISALGNEDSITHKKSELHLYCDLLMQQVHAMKSAATAEGGPEIQVKIY